nr:hypothetical protein CFP56_28490 [Quercus suber]
MDVIVKLSTANKMQPGNWQPPSSGLPNYSLVTGSSRMRMASVRTKLQTGKCSINVDATHLDLCRGSTVRGEIEYILTRTRLGMLSVCHKLHFPCERRKSHPRGSLKLVPRQDKLRLRQ